MSVRFPAILSDSHGSIIAVGSAELGANPNSINFVSGFIPLFKMGTKLTVTRTLRDINVESFEGTVYLSSQNLLQINNIRDPRMESLRRVFSSNTKFAVSPYVLGRKFFPPGTMKKVYIIAATVYFLTDTELKMLSLDPIEVGQQFLIDLAKPFILHNAQIQIVEAYEFDGVFTAYRCIFTDMPDESALSLQSYATKLNSYL